MKNTIIKFFTRYNELILGPLGLLLWFFSAPLIHYIDPVAATYDVAVWQKVIFGLVVFNICTFNVLLLIKIVNPDVFKYLTDQFNKDFTNLNDPCQKLKISLAVYACFLLGLLLAMQTL